MTCPVCEDYEFFCEHRRDVELAVAGAIGYIASHCGWDPTGGPTVGEWWETNRSRFDEDHTLTRLMHAARLLDQKEAAL